MNLVGPRSNRVKVIVNPVREYFYDSKTGHVVTTLMPDRDCHNH